MKKDMKLFLVFILLTGLIMAGCSEKKDPKEDLMPEEEVKEDVGEKESGGWILQEIEHEVPEAQSSSSELSQSSYQANCGDSHIDVNWSSSWTNVNLDKIQEVSGSLQANFTGFPQRFAAGEEAKITINTQSSFTANYESEEFNNGRFAEAYVYTSGRSDVMTSQDRLYALAHWYENGSDSQDFPLKMPSDAEGGDIINFRIVLNELPLLSKPPLVIYTYKWEEESRE